MDTITAWTLDEVPTSLDQAEAASEAGLWVVGSVSYDAGPSFDPALQAHCDPRVPLSAFGVFKAPTVIDRPEGGDFQLSRWSPSQSKSEFEQAVISLKAPIKRGDSYQINHTMRLRAQFEGDPLGFFARMVRAQMAKYSAFIDLGDAAICSASPELFFERHGSRIETRPMKGTRPRHPDPIVDATQVAELKSSEKDRAENTMIVDMARNDLGRIASVGSVEVPELHTIETYPTLHQMTSTVVAETNASLRETFAALFPAASITGAPKFATSHLIADSEESPRGVYTGAVGVLSPDRRVEFNVAIRTAWIDHTTGLAEYGVGCGIVWDSDPTNEWLEAQHKAQLLRRCRSEFRLIETMRWQPHEGVHLLDLHLRRLSRAATHFGFDINSKEVSAAIGQIDASGDLRLRLLVDQDGTYEMTLTPIEALAEDNDPYTLPTSTGAAIPLVGIDDRPVDSTDEFLYHKTTERLRYDEALRRQHLSDQLNARPLSFDTILWNGEGEITEATIGNLVLEVGDAFVTPTQTSGLLPGVFREALLASGLVSEAAVSFADLQAANRVFVVNAVRGWTEVAVGDLAVPATLARR